MRGRVHSLCYLCGSEEIGFLTLEPVGTPWREMASSRPARGLRVDACCARCAGQAAGHGIMLVRVEHIVLS